MKRNINYFPIKIYKEFIRIHAKIPPAGDKKERKDTRWTGRQAVLLGMCDDVKAEIF